MSIDLNTRLAKFEDLVPSKVPFVEGKLEGHRDRLNYSVIGPGVSEDAKQNVKIAEAHGFNIGGVNAAPMNGSGLHSHTTAEVFLVYQGHWRFYWGIDGQEGEVFLNRGDVASFPTNMFRGFQNVGTDRGLLFVVLGENDPGVITWTPKTLSAAKDTGMVLLDDNTLVDTDLKKIPEDKKILDPLNENEIKTFDNYSVEDIEKCVVRFKDIGKMKINKLVMMEMTINTMECLEFFMGYNNNSSCSIRSSKNFNLKITVVIPSNVVCGKIRRS